MSAQFVKTKFSAKRVGATVLPEKEILVNSDAILTFTKDNNGYAVTLKPEYLGTIVIKLWGDVRYQIDQAIASEAEVKKILDTSVHL